MESKLPLTQVGDASKDFWANFGLYLMDTLIFIYAAISLALDIFFNLTE